MPKKSKLNTQLNIIILLKQLQTHYVNWERIWSDYKWQMKVEEWVKSGGIHKHKSEHYEKTNTLGHKNNLKVPLYDEIFIALQKEYDTLSNVCYYVHVHVHIKECLLIEGMHCRKN